MAQSLQLEQRESRTQFHWFLNRMGTKDPGF